MKNLIQVAIKFGITHVILIVAYVGCILTQSWIGGATLTIPYSVLQRVLSALQQPVANREKVTALHAQTSHLCAV